MQSAKDSFYMALRERLNALNPARTVVVDGALRPAIVVAENEALANSQVEDAFVISWESCLAVGGGSRLMKMNGTIAYRSRGSDGSSGDRGRTLGQMDAELMEITQPPRTLVMDYGLIPAKSTGELMFWTEPEFETAGDGAGMIRRIAKTTVYFIPSDAKGGTQ